MSEKSIARWKYTDTLTITIRIKKKKSPDKSETESNSHEMMNERITRSLHTHTHIQHFCMNVMSCSWLIKPKKTKNTHNIFLANILSTVFCVTINFNWKSRNILFSGSERFLAVYLTANRSHKHTFYACHYSIDQEKMKWIVCLSLTIHEFTRHTGYLNDE